LHAANDGGEGQADDDSKEEDAVEDEHLEVQNSDSVFTKVIDPLLPILDILLSIVLCNACVSLSA
jgi:hypothetical protein